MDTKLKLLKVCGVALLLCASAVSAQTIYKQVDGEGRVTFTDQPNPSARVVASFETSRPALQAAADSETTRREAATAEWPPRPAIESARRPVIDSSPKAITQSAPGLAGIRQGEVERAVATLTPLASPFAAQVDANEAARRARQEMRKDTSAAAVLVGKPAPREDHEPVNSGGFTFTYILWALTFFAMAGGLLFVGWQTLRLILVSGFPRWQVGVA